MSRPVKVLSETTHEKAAAMLLKYELTRLPVVRGSKPVGVVARRDLLRLMVKKSEQPFSLRHMLISSFGSEGNQSRRHAYETKQD